jgi:glutaredoxin
MKKKLDDWKLSYETINISEDLPARAFLKVNNHRTVPQLYFGDIHLNKVDTRDFTRDMIMKEIQLRHDENDSGVEFFA